MLFVTKAKGLHVMVVYACKHRGGRSVPVWSGPDDLDHERRYAANRPCPACVRDLQRRTSEAIKERIEAGDTDPWPTN